MLWFILWLLGIPISIYIAVFLYREIATYTRGRFYKKQGFMQLHRVFGGEILMLADGSKCKNQLDSYIKAVEICQQKQLPGFIVNKYPECRPLVFLTDINLIRDFFIKETEVVQRRNTIDLKLDVGLLFEAGDLGLAHRRIFGEFFKMENLNKMSDDVWRVVDTHFKQQTVGADGCLNIKDSEKFIEKIMINVVDALLFGYDVHAPRIDDKSFSEELVDILAFIISPSIAFNPLNILLFGFPHDYNILPATRSINRRLKKLKEVMIEHIKEREVTHALRLNIIDMMIDYNLRAPADARLSYDDMAGNCNLFLVAGYDTTAATLNSLLFTASQPAAAGVLEKTRLELQEKGIRGYGSGKVVTLDALEQSPMLDMLIRENLRVNPPAGTMFPREFTKNFTLGKYSFRKGDLLNLTIGPLMWTTPAFPNERTFDVHTLNEQNKKFFMPFSIGKRNCVGQFLSQMESKVILQYILERYAVRPLASLSDTRLGIKFALSIEKPYVAFKPL